MRRAAQVDSLPVPALGSVDLRQEIVSPDDGAGHQMRKKQDEQEKVPGIPLRRQSAAINVDEVVDRLEGVERDADRQQHAEHGQRGVQPDNVQRLFQGSQEEVRILEIDQQAQVDAEA